MPRQLKAKDATTGETITFTWHDDVNPPTDEEMDQIAAEWRQLQRPSHGASGSWDTPAARAEAFAASDPNYQPSARVNNPTRATLGWARKNPGTVGAMAAGVMAAPFTGGMSVPAMMATEGVAAAGGHVIGDVLGKTVQGEAINPEDLAKNALLEGAVSGMSAGIGPALQGLGRGAYHLALKPRLAMSHSPDDVAELVTTGLEEGINVSTGGFQKAGRLIEAEANEVRKLIEGLNAQGDVRRGLEKIAALRQTWLKRGALDEKISALDDVADQYLRRYEGAMPLEELHNLKQGIWHETQNNWDRSLNPAKIEAQKAFGSGLREEIETGAMARGVDSIGPKNERIGRMADLQEVISGRAGHEQLPGLRQGIEMVGGASPGFVMRAIATSSPVLSSGARMLHSVGKFLDPRSVAPLPGVAPITDERRLLGPAAIPLGPAPDPSFARGVPAAASPRPIRGYLTEGQEVQLGTPRAGSGDPIRDISSLDTSGRMEVQLPENYGRSIEGLDIPVASREAYQANILDRLDIPAMKEMYTPEELWEIKLMVEKNPKLIHLPFQKWKQLLKETAESGAYRKKVEGQPNVRITKDKVQDLYRRYLSKE